MSSRACTDRIGTDGTGNVLQLLLAQIVEGQVELADGILLHARRHADPTGLGECFQTSGYINSIAEDVAVFDHHVAD